MQKTPEDRNCLACAFPFWAQLTADEQEMLCRYTRPVHYRKGARVHSPLESCVGILLLRTGQLLLLYFTLFGCNMIVSYF